MVESERVSSSFHAERWVDGEPWAVAGASLDEALSEPYVLMLDLELSSANADATSMLGGGAVFEVGRAGSRSRTCGIVTGVLEGSPDAHHSRVQVTIEPAAVAMRYRTDSRIFQDKSAPEILQEVFSASLAPFGRTVEMRLDEDYPAHEYCVQFAETDLAFVHRLMQEEGIGYAFEHDGDSEVLVLFDRPAHYRPLVGDSGSTLRYHSRDDSEMDAAERVTVFERHTRVRPNRFVARHFDWTHPSVPMQAEARVEDVAWPDLETYQHTTPVTFHSFDASYGGHDVDRMLRVAAERSRMDVELCNGSGSAMDARPGARFELVDHPRPELNGAWAVTRSKLRYATHLAGARQINVSFKCLPALTPWRPRRRHVRPRIMGVQTATVVGPSGEEIHTDPHGRVKVQFHWDRLGSRDEKSSCWVRVVQTMGGPGWGFSFIPRIGMEVVVTFVEGDPDRPMITGVVYNGEHPPPYEYPADKTRLTIKTRSTPGGGGFNELRFEDKAGAEEIWIHGQRDWNTLIENDLGRTVGRDESQEVVQDRSRRVGRNESVAVGGTRDKRIEIDENEVIGQNRTRQVGLSETVSVGTDRVASVGSNETVSIGKSATHSVGENLTQSIGQSLLQNVAMNAASTVGMNAVRSVVMNDALKIGGDGERRVGKNLTERVGESFDQKVSKDASSKIGGNRSANVKLVDSLTVGAARNVAVAGVSTEQVGVMKRIDAGQSITLSCGDSSLTLNADGTIELAGKTVVVKGDDEVAVVGGVINLN